MAHDRNSLRIHVLRFTQDFACQPGIGRQFAHAGPLRVLLRELRGGVAPDTHATLARRLLGRSEYVERIRLDRGDDVTLLHKMEPEESRVPFRTKLRLRLEIVAAHPIRIIERHHHARRPALEMKRDHEQDALPGIWTRPLTKEDAFELRREKNLQWLGLIETEHAGVSPSWRPQRLLPSRHQGFPLRLPFAQAVTGRQQGLRRFGRCEAGKRQQENESGGSHRKPFMSGFASVATANPCLLIARNPGRS